MLQLIQDGGALGGGRFCLPSDGDVLADASQRRLLLGRGARRIEPSHEQAADGLLFLEQGAARGFGGVRGEDGFEQ